LVTLESLDTDDYLVFGGAFYFELSFPDLSEAPPFFAFNTLWLSLFFTIFLSDNWGFILSLSMLLNFLSFYFFCHSLGSISISEQTATISLDFGILESGFAGTIFS